MRRGNRFIACLAGLTLAAQPCSAAEDVITNRAGVEVRRDAFAGFHASLAFGGPKAQKPRARLQITSTMKAWDAHSLRPVRTHRAPGLELGFTETAAPILYIGGQDAAKLERRLGVRGDTGKVLLVAGGVALIVLLVVAAKETAGFGALPPG